MFAYIADITTEKERGKGMGLFSAAMTLGVVIGPGVGGYLVHYGMAVPFIVSAGLACFSTVLSFSFCLRRWDAKSSWKPGQNGKT